MQRYWYLNVCLGLVISACSLGITANVTVTDESTKQASETSPWDDASWDDATRMKASKKQQLIAVCLPQINALLISKYNRANLAALGRWSDRTHFFLRRNVHHTGTVEEPVVVLYTSDGMPLSFRHRTASGLGATVADAITNLKAMARSKVILDQFVKRAEAHGVVPPGYRVHISVEATSDGIDAAEPGNAPVAPSKKQIIYDPEAIAAANVKAPAVLADKSVGGNMDDMLAGWYDCVIDETTQVVTVQYTAARTRWAS